MAVDKKATLTVPAKYLDDMRHAARRDVKLDGESVAEDNIDDLDSSVDMLNRTVRIYRTLLTSTGDTEVAAVHDNRCSPLVHVLEEFVRRLAGRLDETKEYGPLPMGDVLDIAEALRWAAQEAIRMEPAMDTREAA